jgi:hypothetical protein
MTALTGTGAATNDVFPIVDVSATTAGSKKITTAEMLNLLGTVNAAGTALTGTGYATGDQFGIWDVSATAFKYTTVAELLNGLVTVNAAGTALTGANTATDDQFLIYDLSATAAKYITRAELYESMRLSAVAASVIAAGSTLSVTAALHGGKVIALDTLTGSVCTLPVATGSGNVYHFITKVLATSNSHIIKVADASGLMAGVIVAGDNADGTATPFATTATSDTITLNRTTTGSVRIGGDRIVLTDIATNVYSVSGCTICTGGEATPFSATV